MQTLVSQLKFELLETDNSQTTTLEILDISHEEMEKAMHDDFANWLLSIQIHVASLVLLNGEIPSIPLAIYKEIAESLNSKFPHYPISKRSIMWFVLVNSLMKTARFLIEEKMTELVMKRINLPDILKKMDDRDRNENPLNNNN